MKHRPPSQHDVPPPPAAATPDGRLAVAGVGASAGGLEAFAQLLAGLPHEPGFAIVYVQHLSPQHSSALPELLAAATRLPVCSITDDMPLAANRVYVIPPNAQLRVAGEALRLDARPADQSQYSPIDAFFRSLAEQMPHRAVGVILSGTGDDGALGACEIKAAGGVTIAQAPETARFDGMPRAAIAAGAVDLTLPPEEIGAELVRITQGLARGRSRDCKLESPPLDKKLLTRLFGMLRISSGIDFSDYRLSRVEERLQRRMALVKTETLADYLEHLQANPVEGQRLVRDLLARGLRFFRDPEAFDALRRLVVGELLEHSGDKQRLRVWVPGCASGEEAYSAAMTLLDELVERSSNALLQIFGTDVSETAIEQARGGIYPSSIAGDVGQRLLARYFNQLDGNYRVRLLLRGTCVFARQDLTNDPPISKLDLIFCRDALDPLNDAVRDQLLRVFHYALRPDGILILGGRETVRPGAELFATVDEAQGIYRKLPAAEPSCVPIPLPRAVVGAAPAARPRAASHAQAEANRVMLDRFAPPGVIVNADHQILEFRGDTHKFLAPAPGEASFNLFKMARRGLLYGLRAVLREAERSRAPARQAGLQFDLDCGVVTLNLEAIPLGLPTEPRHYLVLFEEVGGEAKTRPAEPVVADRQAGEEGRKLVRVEQELAANREYLQSIIRDLETANEELQSANEEILSSNEELQSTNEELDSAKEELQSTNEELNTVNDDLHGRFAELSQLNSDLLDILNSERIAIVLVSAELKIRRFTPMAERVLNLIPGDVGRPIGQIKPNIHCPELEQLIRQVIARGTAVRRNVQNGRGEQRLLTIRPQLGAGDRVEGAVLSLFDVGATREHDDPLANLPFAQAFVETSRQPLVVLDGQLRVRLVNQAFREFFQTSGEDAIDRSIDEMGRGPWNIPELRRMLAEIVPRHSHIENYRAQLEMPGGGRKELLINARPINGAEEHPGLILISIENAPPAAN